jgi:hypothetical protein
MSDHLKDQNRRRFLVSSAVAGVAATTAGATMATTATWNAASRASVVLHDARISPPREVLARLGATGARTMALSGDPVRLWRSDAGAVLRDPSTTLLGITGWPELLLFRGMAAETRRHLRYEKLDASSDTFVWLIA